MSRLSELIASTIGHASCPRVPVAFAMSGSMASNFSRAFVPHAARVRLGVFEVGWRIVVANVKRQVPPSSPASALGATVPHTEFPAIGEVRQPNRPGLRLSLTVDRLLP